jgi:hypothetical protein
MSWICVVANQQHRRILDNLFGFIARQLRLDIYFNVHQRLLMYSFIGITASCVVFLTILWWNLVWPQLCGNFATCGLTDFAVPFEELEIRNLAFIGEPLWCRVWAGCFPRYLPGRTGEKPGKITVKIMLYRAETNLGPPEYAAGVDMSVFGRSY